MQLGVTAMAVKICRRKYQVSSPCRAGGRWPCLVNPMLKGERAGVFGEGQLTGAKFARMQGMECQGEVKEGGCHATKLCLRWRLTKPRVGFM